jgi:hypothetical protein
LSKLSIRSREIPVGQVSSYARVGTVEPLLASLAALGQGHKTDTGQYTT